MKDDSGHFGSDPIVTTDGLRASEAEGFPPLSGNLGPDAFNPVPAQPRNADETAEWYRKYRAKLVAPELTAWQSIPGTVRFAVWLWAIVTIVGFVAGCISLAVLLIGGGWALSQM